MNRTEIAEVTFLLTTIERMIDRVREVVIEGCSGEMECLLSELMDCLIAARRQLREEVKP